MSFQLDGFPIIQLAHSTHSHAKKACSPHDSLPQELQTLQNTLSHLQSSVSDPNSPIHQARKSRRQELRLHIESCEEQLRRLKAILKKYNSLPEDDRRRIPLWESVRFSEGGPVQNVAEMKRRISMYGTAIDMLLHLFTHDSHGRMEKVVGRLRGEMKGIRQAVDLVLAKPCGESCGREGALLISFSADDRAWWRELRHSFVRNGYGRKIISSNMDLIQEYVKELGERGALDRGRNHSQSLRNDDFDDSLELEDTHFMVNRGYGNDLVLEAPVARRAVSVMVRNIGFLEEQLLHAPDLWIERMEEDEDTETSDSDSSTPTLLSEGTYPPRGFAKSPLPRPATRVKKHSKHNNKTHKHREKRSEKHSSHHRSHPVPTSQSSTSSSSNSSSKSSFTLSFWGFKQRPKTRAR
jgi:hypothetical protein